MSMPWFLELLELPPHADERAVRRAYAIRVKLIDPALDPAGFARLREAYEAARAWAADEDQEAATPVATSATRATAARVAPTTALPPASVPEPVAAPPPRSVVELDDVTAEDVPLRPAAAAISPREQATRLMARFAARIADGTGKDIRLELEACTTELRLQYIDAPGIFEEVLIDHLARALIGKRAAVFGLATGHFHWQEIGHVAALGPRGAWIEAVESQRMAWSAVAPLVRTGLLTMIEGAEVAGTPLPNRIVTQWYQVREAFGRYPAYLSLYISPARRNEWMSRYEALPAAERQGIETPVRTRSWRSRIRDVPAGGWTAIVLALIVFLISQFDSPSTTTSTATPVPVTASAPESNLQVVIGEPYDVRTTGKGLLDVTLTNRGTSTLYLPKDATPPMTREGHLVRPIFSVIDQNGNAARFIGEVIATTPKDPAKYYIRLNPGQRVTNTFDLAADYAMRHGYRYTIIYRQPVTRTFSIAADGSIRDQIDFAVSNSVDVQFNGTPHAALR
jgi:hypothetical protein